MEEEANISQNNMVRWGYRGEGGIGGEQKNALEKRMRINIYTYKYIYVMYGMADVYVDASAWKMTL